MRRRAADAAARPGDDRDFPLRHRPISFVKFPGCDCRSRCGRSVLEAERGEDQQ
jgi:hypothetical protein